MPNRILYESICASETLDALSVWAERFFYRLLVQVDDFGRMDARPQVLKNKCFQLDDGKISIDDIRSWLKEMAAVELIWLYEVDGRPYLQFVTWEKRQRRRATKSKYPPPPGKRTSSADRPLTIDDTLHENDSHSLADDCQMTDTGEQPQADGCQMTDCGTQLPADVSTPQSSAPVFEYDIECGDRGRACASVENDPPSPVVKIWEREAHGVLNSYQLSELERPFMGKGALDLAALPEAIKLCRERKGKASPEYTAGILRGWREEGKWARSERARIRDEPATTSAGRDPTPGKGSDPKSLDPKYLAWLEKQYAAQREARKEAG